MAVTGEFCPRKTDLPDRLAAAKSHRQTAAISADADANNAGPSGANASAPTSLRWPSRRACSARLATRQVPQTHGTVHAAPGSPCPRTEWCCSPVTVSSGRVAARYLAAASPALTVIVETPVSRSLLLRRRIRRLGLVHVGGQLAFMLFQRIQQRLSKSRITEIIRKADLDARWPDDRADHQGAIGQFT